MRPILFAQPRFAAAKPQLQRVEPGVQKPAENEAPEPFFPPTIPSLAKSDAKEHVGPFKRLWTRLKARFQAKESPVEQQAKLEHLLDELTAAMRAGKVKILKHHGDSQWYDNWQNAPFGPATVQIGERVYIVSKKRKLNDWIRDVYKETWTLKSQDGRFQMRYSQLKQYRIYPDPPQTIAFTYRDDLKGMKFTTDTRTVGDQARAFLNQTAGLLKQYYDNRLQESKAQLKQGSSLDF